MEGELYYALVKFLENGMLDTVRKEELSIVKKIAHTYALDKKKRLLKTYPNSKSKIVVPMHQKKGLLHQIHDEPLGGHLGQENTYQRASQQYTWPNMKPDIIEYVRTCKTCQKRSRRKGENPLTPIRKKPEPFYQVSIDVMGPLPRTPNGKRYVVVAVDHFTKWTEARALEEADAQNIATFLYEEIIARHGVPSILTSDRGTEFVNELITIMCNKYKIRHIVTTAYHPQANGQVE
jgi:hypothetical protein